MLDAELIDSLGEIHVINWRELWAKLLVEVEWQAVRALTETERGAAGRLRGRARQDRPAPRGRCNDRFDAPQGRPCAHR
jgi:hypothetical protein